MKCTYNFALKRLFMCYVTSTNVCSGVSKAILKWGR